MLPDKAENSNDSNPVAVATTFQPMKGVLGRQDGSSCLVTETTLDINRLAHAIKHSHGGDTWTNINVGRESEVGKAGGTGNFSQNGSRSRSGPWRFCNGFEVEKLI